MTTRPIALLDGKHLAYVLHHESRYAAMPSVDPNPHMTVMAAIDDDRPEIFGWNMLVTAHHDGIRIDQIDNHDDPTTRAVRQALADATTFTHAVEILRNLGAVDETERTTDLCY